MLQEQKQKYNLGWPYVIYVIYVGSLLSIAKSGKISHYNLGHACYSQAQIELCLVLMLCFCSVHHRFYKFP